MVTLLLCYLLIMGLLAVYMSVIFVVSIIKDMRAENRFFSIWASIAILVAACCQAGLGSSAIAFAATKLWSMI